MNKEVYEQLSNMITEHNNGSDEFTRDEILKLLEVRKILSKKIRA